jgi:predicted DNA-binding protein with PD1-like motif
MRHNLIGDTDQARQYAVVFDVDDEVIVGLRAWAQQHSVQSASFSGVGAFRTVTLGYFDVEARDYVHIAIEEQVEVLALAGTIALAGATPQVHAHVVVGKRDGTAHGGHLLGAYVRPTLELIVLETSVKLRRTLDPATGLPLLDQNPR